MTVRIGITCGDINGIGPEIAHKALASSKWGSDVEFVWIGPAPMAPDCSVWDIPLTMAPSPGDVTAGASRTAVAAIERAVQGCLFEELDAMVTAPICKEGLELAGVPFPGHTEMIATMTGTSRYGMMLMGRGLRVMLVTRHLPLREVADALTQEAVQEAIELTGEGLKKFGIKNARIGVCGLNPHSGDNGTIGDEEGRIIVPAIEKTQKSGLNVTGPIPADVIFYQALHGQYDAVVAMYHDQGLAPLKMHAFDCGVNITLGLPIIRTSPDHGTAFDIAGTDSASADSMVAAIKTAVELACKKKSGEG
jgi:4-hydroxythreonine-4-phosphate dehydrogenase